MESVLSQLKELQVIDKEIYDLEVEQQDIPFKISEIEKRLDEQKNIVSDIEERFKELKLELNEKELNLKSQEELINKYNGQLSQVKTNKEYSALKSEITKIKVDNSMLEEEILEEMDKVQVVEKEVGYEKEKMSRIEKEYREKKEELLKEVEENKKRITELNEIRVNISSKINKNILADYERLLKSKSGIAMARVEDDVCGVCQMRLLSQTLSEVILGEKIVYCQSCHRILYMDKEEKTE